MQFRIPLTDLKISLGVDPDTSSSRGFSKSQSVRSPEKDMTGFKISSESMFTAWRNSADIAGCVSQIRKTCGIGGYVWYDPSDPKKEKPAKDEDIKRVVDALSYQYGSPRELKNRAIKPHLIAGQSYLERIRNPLDNVIGFKALDPRTIAIVSDSYGNIYRFIQTASESLENPTDKIDFAPEDIIHWKNGEDPDNEIFGFSPLEHAIWEARIDLAAMISNYFMFENRGVPAYQYILEENLTEGDVKQAVADLQKQFKGPKNRGKGGVIKGVKDIKQLQLTPQDMEYLLGRKFSTEKICAAYDVPKVLLGYTEGVNYTNHEGQMEIFYEGTVRDYELSWEEVMNKEIIPSLTTREEEKNGINFGDRIGFIYKPATFDSKQVLWDRATEGRSRGLLTINEGRKIIGQEQLDPAKHGDMGDQIILGDGGMATLLTDVGATEPSEPEQEMEEIKRFINKADKGNMAMNDLR